MYRVENPPSFSKPGLSKTITAPVMAGTTFGFCQSFSTNGTPLSKCSTRSNRPDGTCARSSRESTQTKSAPSSLARKRVNAAKKDSPLGLIPASARNTSQASDCLRALISRESTTKRGGASTGVSLRATDSSNHLSPAGTCNRTWRPVDVCFSLASRNAASTVSAAAAGITSVTSLPINVSAGAASRSCRGEW